MNWAYLVRCNDNSLYAGWTNDLEKRVKAHNSGTGAKYTRAHGPVTLAWAESYETKQEAMKQEAKIKKMRKEEKENLVKEYKNKII